MNIERHETGPRMSKVVIHGDTVYLAASLPIVRKTKTRRSRPEAFCRRSIAFLASAGTNKTEATLG